MPRYEPRAWVGSRTLIVIDDDQAPVRTGLLDMHGVPLYRMPDKAKCGFGR